MSVARKPNIAELVPWLALAAAFSPVLFDLTRNLVAAPGDRYTLVAPLLMLLAWPKSDRTAPRPGGYLVVALGVGLELLGVLAGSSSIARAGLPIAVIGLARARGFPRVPFALLSLWAIPIPVSVLLPLSPWLESALARFAATVVGICGADLAPVGPLFLGAQGRFELGHYDAGVTLAWTLAALGWYAALRRDDEFVRGVARALGWSLLALGVQPLSVCLAVGIYALGAPELARTALTYAPWLAAVAVGLAWTRRVGH